MVLSPLCSPRLPWHPGSSLLRVTEEESISPKRNTKRPPKRDPVLGWCTFHIHEDWRDETAQAFSQASRKI